MKQLQLSDHQTIDAWRNEFHRANRLDETGNITLKNASDEEFIQLFLALRIFSNKELSPHSIRAYRNDLNTIAAFLKMNRQRFSEIDFIVVKAYNTEVIQTYSNRTAVRKLDFFRRLLEFGYITQFYKSPLAEWIEKPSIKKGHYSESGTLNRSQLRELSEREAKMLVQYFDVNIKAKMFQNETRARNRLIGQLLLLTGMRASEILNLNWGSFRLNRRDKLVVDVIGKGKKERTIPVLDDVRTALSLYRETLNERTELDPRDISPLFFNYIEYFSYGEKKRLSYPTLFRIVKHAVEVAGMEEAISPHWFRHSFCTTALSKDIPLSVVRQTMGHSSIATTNLYLERLQDEEMADAFEKANF